MKQCKVFIRQQLLYVAYVQIEAELTGPRINSRIYHFTCRCILFDYTKLRQSSEVFFNVTAPSLIVGARPVC